MDDFTDQDKVALLALVTRYTRTQIDNNALAAARDEIDMKLAAGRAQIAKMVGAFSIFGFDVSGGKTPGGGFQKIRNLVGSKAYLGALSAGGRDPSESSTRDEDSGQPSETVQSELPLSTDDDAASATIRETALAQLVQAGEVGTTAAAIRDHIEKARGTKLHFKTVGMTLYRLAQDGQARREGRTWFAVPHVAETANPGG